MRFTCTHDNLLSAVNAVAGIAGRGGHLPVLQHILIVAKESGVELVATDLEVVVRAQLRAKVDTPGSFTVPARTLLEYIALLSEPQIEFVLDGTELAISAGASSTKMKGITAEEYPVIPERVVEQEFVVEAGAFKKGLSDVVIATAKTEIRPELSGVFFSFGSERFPGLLVAATDSYRLAEAKIPLKQKAEARTCIVPAKTVHEVIRLLQANKREGESTVAIGVSDNQWSLLSDGIEIISRVVDGKYPDYAQIIPTSFKTTAIFPKEVIMKKIKAAGIFTTSGVNAVSFDVNASEQTIGVSSTSRETGEFATTIEAEVTGEENSILLNHRYTLDGLQHLADGDVVFGVNSGEAPCLLKSKADEAFVYIVMPIRQ